MVQPFPDATVAPLETRVTAQESRQSAPYVLHPSLRTDHVVPLLGDLIGAYLVGTRG